MSAEQPGQQSREEVSPIAPPSVAGASGHLSLSPRTGVLFAMAGGALAWIAFLVYYPFFSMPMEMQDLAGPSATADQDRMLAAAMAKAIRQNTIFALALVGALVGASLGIAEGVARRSLKAVIFGAVVVAAIGGATGVAGGLLSDLTYVTIFDVRDPLELGGTVLIHAVALSVLGAGIGLGLGATTGSGRAAGNCLFAGVLAGLGAGLLYPIVLAFALPGAQTQVLVPISAGSQLVWIALIAGLLGLIVPGTAAKRPARSVAVSTSATTNVAP